MAAHQVIAGALNRGEHVYAVGSVEGINFTACAVGADVVILAGNLERVQVIPGPADCKERIVTSVSCCNDSGKIAATYGEQIRIFEPTHTSHERANHNLNFRWFETQKIHVAGTVSSVLWTMEGLRIMVVVGNRLSLYQHRSVHGGVYSTPTTHSVMFCISEEDKENSDSQSGSMPMTEWDEIWNLSLAQPPQYIQFSPDGSYFATCGPEDLLVKIWYPDSPAPSLNFELGSRTDELAMNFFVLQHPKAVRGFEWRRTGRYMPRKCIQNTLMTWCEDNVARVWKETPPQDIDADVAGDTCSDSNLFYELKGHKKKGITKLIPVKRTRRRIMNKLKSLAPERERRKKGISEDGDKGVGIRAQMTKTPSYAEFDPLLQAGVNVEFHLAATINADTDCLLVPLMEHGSRHQKHFSVHWLNNKELVFSHGAEKLLAEALMGEHSEGGSRESSPVSSSAPSTAPSANGQVGSGHAPDNGNGSNGLATFSHGSSTTLSSIQTNTNTTNSVPSRPVSVALSVLDGESVEDESLDNEGRTSPEDKHTSTMCSDVSSKDVLDVKLEMLLRQWAKSVDILYTVHPVDGSLVTWTVEYLDDAHRQPQVSFTSRLPNAFPLTDAASLHSNLVTFNPHDPVYVEVLKRNGNQAQDNLPEKLPDKLAERRNMNTIFLLTNHDNGSLNLWQLSMDENSLFSTILSIQHLSRMCGHRFQISQVVAHPVLPLLLTSSQFAKEHLTEEVVGSRDSLSEVILWKINPVGPLCKSGGVQELARVAHAKHNAFDYLGWIPAILPSCTLGSVCNSPSSCFVASNGRDLMIYQAVVDARGLLTEIFHSEKPQSPLPKLKQYMNRLPPLRSSPEPPKALSDAFNIVSTQSTAKPGCVLEIGKIESALDPNSSLILLHVFNERLLVDNEQLTEAVDVNLGRFGPVVDRSKDIIFSDRFFIVLVERGPSSDSFLMYSLDLSSHPAKAKIEEDLTSPMSSKDASGFLRSASPNLPSVANLLMNSTKICHQRIPLPEGTRVVAAHPAAGHLSSSSLYPACKAPFVLVTSCTDDVVRFWKCVRDEKDGVPSFSWCEWRMVSDSLSSELEVDGMIYAVSAAHSGRFACAYDSAYQSAHTSSKSTKVQLVVFECESSGGVEWLREDTLIIDNVTFPQLKLPRLEDFGVHESPRITLDDIVSDLNMRPSQRNGSLLRRIGSASHGFGGAPTPPTTPATVSSPDILPTSGSLSLQWLVSSGLCPPSLFPERTIADNIKRAVSSHALRAQQLYESLNMREVVRIDWVSTEDGAHILTVGVAANIYLYTQVSQDPAQQNIIAMKEAESNLRRPALRKASSLISAEIPMMLQRSQMVRWVCTRVLELQSADGLPPIPTCLTWARDGLLIVGMQSEMRCYCQWNLSAQAQPDKEEEKKPPMLLKKTFNTSSAPTLTISPSHSMLEQLGKKGKEDKKQHKIIFDIVNKAMSKESMPSSSSGHSKETPTETFAQEGIFEAVRMANPILPQYHPKQLIVLLNGGRTKRVKAILLHVLKSLKVRTTVSAPSPLSRAASIRRMSTVEGSVDAPEPSRIQIEESLDYDEIDDIAPLPLFSLMAADEHVEQQRGGGEGGNDNPSYDGLFDRAEEDDLDRMLADDDSNSGGGRSRNVSTSSDQGAGGIGKAEEAIEVNFTAKHNRLLVELLTHTHLPGISSVDQMHLLAIADTLSHFSADVMDKLAQANAAFNPVAQSVLGEGTAGGYATATAGAETLDECGLRFLMAMKQHEYLLVCLPMKMRGQLKVKGLASAHVIWAQHSETENELLNAIPAMQKANTTWDDLRALGVAWWLKNGASLRITIEKLAKAAFQAKSEPLDAAIFYLALRKKNILTHLFRSVGNQMMTDFFQQDFTTSTHWQKAAMKNAFVLMSKQRFQHAAAFFLLAGSLKDAIQVIMTKLNDIQLAMVVLRLYETDPEVQQNLLKEMLCKEVLGLSVESFDSSRGRIEDEAATNDDASRDPFVRSMAYWLLKDYARAAHTLVQEANSLNIGHQSYQSDVSLSNIFNFYYYLRRHPLVVRQRLTDAGVQVGSTEKFLAVARKLEVLITPAERRLFFRTAAQHMALGCPMLALDVLSRLPKEINMLDEGAESLRRVLANEVDEHNMAPMAATALKEKIPDAPVDWSAPTNVMEKDDLALEWSDDEDEEEEEKPTIDEAKTNGVPEEHPVAPIQIPTPSSSPGIIDIISQHMKFVACLRILTEELSTLASGFEVDGGQLRYQLFHWLEREVDVLKRLCDYRTSEPETYEDESLLIDEEEKETALHEQISKDRAILAARYKIALQRRKWLISNQKLLRSFTSFCSLHSAQNHRLTSALMELLLLLLEVQKDSTSMHLQERLPDMSAFPLLVASVSSYKMFVSSPLAFIENQCTDLLSSIVEQAAVPRLDHSIKKVFVLYNLCQGLSSCVYQSLSDVDGGSEGRSSGALTRRTRTNTGIDDITVTTSPAKWPGVENVVALLGRERDEDAPQLRLLLAESFVAITISLFSFALAAYDARWLFRLSAHYVDDYQFSAIFGGGGEKKIKPTAPARPPRPAAPVENSVEKPNPEMSVEQSLQMRAKYHAKVFGLEKHPVMIKAREEKERLAAQAAKVARPIEQTIYRWVPPKKNIVQMYAERVNENLGDEIDAASDAGSEAEVPVHEEEEPRDYANPHSYAWTLMRLALVVQQVLRMKQFLTLAGFDLSEIASVSPRVSQALKLLEGWAYQLREELRSFPGGCPPDLLPNVEADTSEDAATAAPSLRKYRALLEPGNTPFENEGPHALPVKRLWVYLARQDNLQNIFITNIFTATADDKSVERMGAMPQVGGDKLPEAYKIIQREHEPIVAFACSQERPGLLVVSTGRELQEMDISSIFDDGAASSWMSNRTELDVALFGIRKDPQRDNDDYQLLTDAPNAKSASAKMLFKRPIGGIRRVDSHPSAPYYATGSSDGSIRVWEWGIGQPLFIPRHAGQHAKVTKLSYSANGNKLAASDGDGMVCVWQAGMGGEMKAPFFCTKAHNRTTNDVRFISHSSSMLVTAGDSAQDLNVCVWDTLLPSCRSCVHAFQGHTEGATCAVFVPSHMMIISGGVHGEICLWDVRQRTLRTTVKAWEPTQAVTSLVIDPANDIIAAGNSEGDIKIYSNEPQPQLMYTLPGEHAARGGFSFRQVGQTTVLGVQQLFVDQEMRMFSCGADCSLNFRLIPSVYNLI